MSVTLPRLWGRQSQVVRERKGETNIETKKKWGKERACECIWANNR